MINRFSKFSKIKPSHKKEGYLIIQENFYQLYAVFYTAKPK